MQELKEKITNKKRKEGGVTAMVAMLFFMLTIIAAGMYYRTTTTNNLYLAHTENYLNDYIEIRNARERLHSQIVNNYENLEDLKVEEKEHMINSLGGYQTTDDLYARIEVEEVEEDKLQIVTYLENHPVNTTYNRYGYRDESYIVEPLEVSRQVIDIEIPNIESGGN